jgi:predicted AAA+ superfamily ATPase
MLITRKIQVDILNHFHKGKAILIEGPRQVGKTTLIQTLLKSKNCLLYNGDDVNDRVILSNLSTVDLRQLLNNYDFVFIDEIQRIPNIGLTIKIIVDQLKDIQVIATGSSAFELNNITQESLTGRKWEYKLFPFSWEEYENHYGYANSLRELDLRVVYGMYPDVVTRSGEEIKTLNSLKESYLYKDILAYEGIKMPDKLEMLLKLLAYQIGSQVNYNELSNELKIDNETVARYINLLEKSYVVFSLPSFSRNLRNELKKSRKIYFYDTGIRNAIIGDFSVLSSRQDRGALWENFLVSERIKKIEYDMKFARSYFWRTTQKQEIDYVEHSVMNELSAYEFKYNPKSKAKITKVFENAYKVKPKLITKDNFREFLMDE